jgi:hypothetical protein
MLLIGIDPGLDGGIAIIGLPIKGIRDEESIWACTMPTKEHYTGKGREIDVRMVRSVIDGHRLFSNPVVPGRDWGGPDVGREAVLIAIESVRNINKGRKMGASTMFAFGDGFGKLRALLELESWATLYVTPQTWQKVVLLGKNKGDSKKAALSFVSRRYPAVELKASAKCKKPHDGKVDALCLAEYARRTL